MKIDVLYVEDDFHFSTTLTDFLNLEPDIRVANTCNSKSDALSRIACLKYDICLIDLNLNEQEPGNADGLEVAFEISKCDPDAKIIMLTSSDDPYLIEESFAFGNCSNYVLKRYFKDLPRIIREVYHNQTAIHHAVYKPLINSMRHMKQREIKFTLRQRDILCLYEQGLSRREVASTLFLTEQSVSNEMHNLLKTLRGRFPYLEWLGLKKVRIPELLDMVRQLNLYPTGMDRPDPLERPGVIKT